MSGQIVEETGSTNDLAKKMISEGAPHGAWVSARNQTDGRGRQGRKWVGMPGNLFLSVVARNLSPTLWTWIPLATGVAAARAVESLGGSRIKIKWPNDLWVGDAKVGGILCEGSIQGDRSSIVIGVGLNCASAPEGLDQPVAHVGISADALRPVMVSEILKILEELKTSHESVAQEYHARSVLTPGTPIRVSDMEAKVLGLGPQGDLRIVNHRGDIRSLVAEDVFLLRSRS